MEERISLMLADDEVLFRTGISFYLNRKRDIEILFEASDGQELVEHLRNCEKQPNIILMDLKMPFLNGVEATKIIRRDYPKIKVIALTSYNTPSFISNMIQEGAASYLLKNAHPDEMLKTIREVASKGFYYNEDVLEIIMEIRDSQKKIQSPFSEGFFTERERQVLELICMQYTLHEMADLLCVSPRTVEGYKQSLLEKSKTKNIAGLVVFAIYNKIINPDNLLSGI